ncbi:MAG TPA: PspC domain-containing protein [Allosphingosinicella sp.]|jgi:phage shock protein PspC (stress-responsive transcriptional regulator)
MQTSQTSVFTSDRTLFGVCEALGEDLGFNPIFLRVPLAICLMINPVAVIAAYFGLGLLVAFTRFVAPDPKPAAVSEADPRTAEAELGDALAEPEMALAA